MNFWSRRTVLAAAALIPMAALAQGKLVKLVALGDSLTAGYGLKPGEDFATRLEAALKKQGLSVSIANAGVSGDTTQGGLERLDWSVPDGTQGVILELGANDALRGLPPANVEANLSAIITRLQARKIPVLLAGMQAPPNMGQDYRENFDAIYMRLAKKHGVSLYHFFLDGVAGNPKLNLPDGMHPTAEGIEMIVNRIAPMVEGFIKQIQTP